MVAFFLDEDVPEDLARFLRDRGYFATTTREEGQKGSPDYRQFWFAAERGWTLITMNRKDYTLLHGAWLLWGHEWRVVRQHAGVLLVPQVSPEHYEGIADAIHRLVRDPDSISVNALFLLLTAGTWKRSPR